MALVLADRVQQTGSANTTVSFTLSGSVTGFQSFAVVGNTNTTYYSAFDVSGNWEVGLGTYSTTGPTLTRTTIFSSSNSNTAVTFSGTVNVFLTYPSSFSMVSAASGSNSEFAATTALLFYQATAPTGWTKSTTNDNKALRVVSGATGGSSGGTVAFTTAFASQAVAGTVGGYTLTTADIPAHSHGITDPGHSHSVNDPGHSHILNGYGQTYTLNPGGAGNFRLTYGADGNGDQMGTYASNAGTSINGAGTGISTTNTGSSGSHTHGFTGTSINLAVQYVDTIICTKN